VPVFARAKSTADVFGQAVPGVIYSDGGQEWLPE
jgi:hypothetical protein